MLNKFLGRLAFCEFSDEVREEAGRSQREKVSP
jgi:hypothetical protein